MKKNHDNFTVGRIMIVDDEAELMTALCEALAGQGYETRGFTAGADALKVLVEQDYDLLLTDLMMPEMDGITLLQAGLEIDPNLVCIIMTGQGTVQTAVEAMKTGAFDYVLKPFKLNALLPLLSRAMEVRSMRMENIQLRETVAIHELGKVIAFSSDLNAILNKVADATLQQCSADEVSIMLPTGDGKELYVAVARGGHREYIGERVPMERGIAGWVARNRETVIINGTVDDPRFSPVNPRDDIRAAVSMPMLAGGNLVGVLNVNVTKSHRHMTLGQVKALSILVSIISPILENTWLNIQIRQAEEKYRSIFENANEAIFVLQDGKMAFFNPMTVMISGYSSEELTARPFIELVHPDDRNMAIDRHVRRMKGEDIPHLYSLRILCRDGSIKWVEASAKVIVWQEKTGALFFVSDITERKQAEEALRESEELFRSYLENAPDGVYLSDLEGNFLYGNRKCEEIIGYRREELVGKNFLEVNLLPEKSLNLAVKLLQANMEGRSTGPDEIELISKEGRLVPVEINTSVVQRLGQRIVLSFARDITDRKQAEEALRESERRFMDVLYSSQDAVLLIDGEKFVDCNEATARMLGYASRNDFLQTHPSELSPPVQPDGRNSFEKANEMMRIASERGFHQFEWEHRRADGEDFPVEVSLTSIVLHGKNVIHCMWRDLTERKRTEAELQRTLKRLKNAVNTTIQVMASAIEVRDPYTSGHQIRSANLARVIATEMGLPPNIIDGIRMAGSIHDIGKLSIPAEILSKPTRLTNIEFSLIKEHSQSGYEMLKDVESPWPLAEIVYQHHERMDGSGYPRHLKGEEILMEARIMAVADVAESMASHRPYRPALGIDAALEEIEKNRGTLYDNAVADACLRLFREKRFQFDGA